MSGKTIEELELELQQCKEIIEQLENECELLRSNEKQTSFDMKKTQKDIEDRNRIMIKNLQNQMSMLKHENNALKVANAALKDSISWKVTKPLRDVGSIFIKG